MKQRISWPRIINLRLTVTVFLTAFTFIAISAFSYSESFQAQAETLVVTSDSYFVDKDTAKKITKQAEDHVGDRPIGDTGLKNIKKLGENISETTKIISSQRFGSDNPKNILANAQDRVKGAGKETAENAKDKIKEAAENVVEKLNLDEPLPKSTKKFLDSVESQVDNTVEPMTGNQGYYKEEK